MDENQRGYPSNEEDDTSHDEETGASGLETNSFMIESSSYSKLSVENLTRRPLRQEKERVQAKSKKQHSNLTNKEVDAKVDQTGSLVFAKFYVLFSVIFILCVMFLYLYWVKPSLPNKQLDVQQLMGELRSTFDGQPKLTYRVIEAAVKRASSKNSESPGIIILISSKKTMDTTNKLANRLVQLVSDPLHFVLIDSRYFSSAKQLKKEIDVTIRGNLTREPQMRAVLVRNLDQIPFEAAMIFHSYCDHENAPFKRVIYVMTTFVEETISSNSDSKDWDMLASKHLKGVWRDSEEDQVASLISRLTVSVAAVISKE